MFTYTNIYALIDLHQILRTCALGTGTGHRSTLSAAVISLQNSIFQIASVHWMYPHQTWHIDTGTD